MLMSYKVEVLRGWPHDGSLDNYERILSPEVISNGNLVRPTSTGAVTSLGATGVGLSGTGIQAGLVIAGNGDSASAAQSGKATVLWGNAIIRVDASATSGVATAGLIAAAVGTKVTVFASADGQPLQFAVAGVGDEVVGFVKENNAATATSTANLVIVLN